MFSKLTGNNNAKEFLTRLVTIGRVPNSLLFAGPDGVGKRHFALELARTFVCRSPAEGESCGDCPSCRRVGVFALATSDKSDDYDRVFFGEHSDVGMVIAFKRNLRVGAIRELEREANFRPYEARARVFIVDDADKMNEAASNALLKTLEEPPSTSHIILITSRPDSLLATIRSRCQIVRFAPVATDEIEALLIERGLHTREDAALAAKLSSGSISRAVSIDLAKFRAQRHLMLGVLEHTLASRDRSALLRTGEQMNDAKNKDDYEETLAILEGLIRDVWLLKSGTDASQILNFDLLNELNKFADIASSSKLASWLTEIELLRQTFLVNINRKVATDALFMKMSG